MAYPVTLNGRTYTLADFEGTNYVEGLPDAFEDFVTHAGDIYNSTSTTSNSIGTGSKTFTVESAKPYQAGTPLRIADAAAPSTNFMDTIVTSYSGTTLVVDAVGYAGSGTFTSWNVNIGGAASVAGTVAIAQGGTGATTAAAARTNLDVYSKADADSRFLNVSGEASDVTMNGNTTIGDTNADTLTINAVPTIQTSDPILKLYSTGSNRNTHIYMGDSTDVDAGRLSYDIAQDQMSLWTNGAKSLTINSDSTTSIINDNSGTGGANLHLYHDTAAAADGDYAGDLVFYSNSDAGNKRVFSRIRGYAEDVTDTSEDAILFFFNRMAGVERESLRLTSTINQFNAANQDIDFKVSSQNLANALFVNAALDAVGINETSPNAKLHITTGTNSGTGLEIETGLDNGSFSNPVAVNITQSGGTVSEGVYPWYASIGGAQRAYQFVSRNGASTGSKVVHAATDSSNTMRTRMEFTNDETTFNEGSRDFNFRVESDGNSHALYMDAGASKVSINTASSANGILNVYSPTTYGKIFMSDSTLGYGYGAFIQGYGVSGSGGYFQLGSVDANTQTVAMQVNQQATNINFLTRDGAAGTSASRLTLDQTGGGGAVFNEPGTDYDFRVESNSHNSMLKVDAGNDAVLVGSGTINPNTSLGIFSGQITGYQSYTVGTTEVRIQEGTGGMAIMRNDTSGGVCLVVWEFSAVPVIVGQVGSNFTTGTPTGNQIQLLAGSTPSPYGIKAKVASGTQTLRILGITCDPD